MVTKFNESKLHILEDYIQGGSSAKLEDEEIVYLEILCGFNSMRRKYGQNEALKFYQKEPYSLSAYVAKRMLYESINLFYSDDTLDKKALRNLKAEQLEKTAEALLLIAETAREFEVYGDLQMKAAKLRQLDKIDPPEIPEELYKKHIKYYTLDGSLIGIEKPDRRALAHEIDALDIQEKHKQRLKRDGLMEENLDIVEILSEQNEED
jgi:hypothetical protein